MMEFKLYYVPPYWNFQTQTFFPKKFNSCTTAFFSSSRRRGGFLFSPTTTVSIEDIILPWKRQYTKGQKQHSGFGPPKICSAAIFSVMQIPKVYFFFSTTAKIGEIFLTTRTKRNCWAEICFYFPYWCSLDGFWNPKTCSSSNFCHIYFLKCMFSFPSSTEASLAIGKTKLRENAKWSFYCVKMHPLKRYALWTLNRQSSRMKISPPLKTPHKLNSTSIWVYIC